MNEDIKKYLLSVARGAIAEEFGIHHEEKNIPKDSKILKEKRGVFVTLELDSQLKGCIGNIMPVYSLLDAVKKNAVSAAFWDPRFAPLSIDEFDDVVIEISVLSVPKKLKYKGADQLLDKLQPLKDGVVLKKGTYEATYLPQVWESVPDKEEFLGSLCMKAGLPVDEWKKGELEISIYHVELFKEKK